MSHSWTLAISTLLTSERRIDRFLDRNRESLRHFDEVLVVCQGQLGASSPEVSLEFVSPPIRLIRCDRPGISASRNEAIRHFTSEIIWFMDDDVVLAPALPEIRNSIAGSPAEINTLRIQDPGTDRLYKSYPPERDLHGLDLLRVSSIEITCKRSFLSATPVRFPEWIGIGTPLPGGEENLFLRQASRAGARIRHLPHVGGRHPLLDGELSAIWNRPNRMRSMGIVARDCGPIGLLLCVRWSLRGFRAGVQRGRIADLWSGYFEGARPWMNHAPSLSGLR